MFPNKASQDIPWRHIWWLYLLDDPATRKDSLFFARPLAAQYSGCHVSYVFIFYIRATIFAQAYTELFS
jgi:hypothetical protein